MNILKCFKIMWKCNSIPNRIIGLIICPIVIIISALFQGNGVNGYSLTICSVLYIIGSTLLVSFLSSFKLGVFFILPLENNSCDLKGVPKSIKRAYCTYANFMYSGFLVLIVTLIYVIIKTALFNLFDIGSISNLPLEIFYSLICIFFFETKGFYSMFKDAIPFILFISIIIIYGLCHNYTTSILKDENVKFLLVFLVYFLGYILFFLYSRISYEKIDKF